MSDDLKTYEIWPEPLPLQVMMHKQWDHAFDFLFATTASVALEICAGGWLARTKASTDHAVTRATINELVEVLFERKQVELALAWSFLAADPARVETIQGFIPQVAEMVENIVVDDEVFTDTEAERVRQNLNVWMDAAGGKYVDSELSVFAIAARRGARDLLLRARTPNEVKTEEDAAPGLVVMPKGRSSKLTSENASFKDLVGKKLPFVLAKDVRQVQATLRGEYPHAWQAIDLLTRDLREGKPVRMKPVILLGDPGSGKSRLVRRLGQLLQTSVYRFDASSVADAISWAGTARSWGNTTPSVPARAVQQSMQANPIVLVDEIEKTGEGRYGSLHSAMTPFLEKETAKRIRDLSLDAELDLSFVSYISTANDDTAIPTHIRDRFRVVRVPLPTLEHLRPLAANIMADLAAEEDVDPRWMTPLDADEEAVIAKAWTRAGLSIRNLQKIVGATLEARDAVAMRN